MPERKKKSNTSEVSQYSTPLKSRPSAQPRYVQRDHRGTKWWRAFHLNNRRTGIREEENDSSTRGLPREWPHSLRNKFNNNRPGVSWSPEVSAVGLSLSPEENAPFHNFFPSFLPSFPLSGVFPSESCHFCAFSWGTTSSLFSLIATFLFTFLCWLKCLGRWETVWWGGNLIFPALIYLKVDC